MTTQEIHKGIICTSLKPINRACGSFFLGNTLSAIRDPLSFLKNLKTGYEDIIKIRIGSKIYYVIQSPDAVRHVLQENAKNYYKPGAAKMMKRFLGEGLATSNGNEWLKQRRLIQPAFHKKKISSLVDTIEFETAILVNEWKKNKEDQLVAIDQVFLNLTLANISKTMFGADLRHHTPVIANVINNLLASASSSVTSLIKLPLYIPSPANRKFTRSNKAFEKIIYSIIEERQQANKQHPGDLLDMLLNAHGDHMENSMSAKQLRDEITTIFMAGHETTAQTLSWVFYQLAVNPGIKQKLREETSLLNGNENIFEALQQMNFTKAVIEETMRIYPPVWVMARKSSECDNINGYLLPAGSTVLINIYGMNHYGDYWKNPELFQPERMNTVEKENRHSFLFIPFGAGQRPCVGNMFAMMVMQVVIARLVNSFDFKIPPGYVVKPEPNVTLRAKDGIKLIVKNL